MKPILYAMASLETTPAPITDAKRKFLSRRPRRLFVFAGLLLAVVAAVLALRSRSDPLQRQLIGVWKLEQQSTIGRDERIVEFREGGRYLIYLKQNGKYEPESTLDGWRTSRGDLVLALTNPDAFAKDASIGQRLKDAAQIIGDRLNGAYSNRYTVVDEGDGTIEFVPQSKNDQPFKLQRMQNPLQ
jgi:hypothetical protein